ncbi:RRQRL motif-containing zinc-binding protein [Kitasatospora cineracea]|uniref:RRQRL motif-containing zinc-binding protein n=1 Tax=Kitasatospora cineracea TaxID=88074 RepID=UPI00340FE790
MSRPRFWDPAGERFGTPTYPWRLAPDGLKTRRQLRACGLRPGGQPVAAQVMWRSRRSEAPRVSYLYRVQLAKPVRPFTLAKRRALDAANLTRRTCPSCGRDAGYILPARLGTCLPCADSVPFAA